MSISILFRVSCLIVVWSWSTLTVAGVDNLESVAYLALTDGYWQAWRMAPDGSRQTQITRSPYDKSRLSWYPDGARLLVNGNQGELVTVDVETGEEQDIHLGLGGMNDAVLSPDGHFIAFSLSTAGSIDDNNIWIANTKTGDLQKLTNMKRLQHEPAWGPDGKWLYFLSGRGEQTHDIWRVSLSNHDLEQLTSGHLYHFDVAVSRSGVLAFSSNRSGNYEIWEWMLDRPPRRLTDDPALDARPAWSPQGKSLLFESTRGGGWNIWRLDLADASPQPVRITSHPQGARQPVWWQGTDHAR